MARTQGAISAARQAARNELDTLRQTAPGLIQSFYLQADPGHVWPTGGRVYQYTRYETLRSMMGGSVIDTSRPPDPFPALWATSALHLNDAEEFKRGRDLMNAALASLPQDGVTRRMRQALDDADGLEVYCACFTARPDDLSQWRGYGEDGAGVAVEFDLAELLAGIQGVGYWVVYGKPGDEATQRQVAESLARYVHDAVENLLPNPVPGAVWAEVKEQLGSLFPALFLAFKHRDFAAEEEFRVVYSEAVVKAVPVCFRPHPLVPFVKLPMRSGPLPVRSITLGAAIKSDTNRRSLRFALDTLGLPLVKVHESDIPYVPR